MSGVFGLAESQLSETNPWVEMSRCAREDGIMLKSPAPITTLPF